jgi:5'-nucleotidase
MDSRRKKILVTNDDGILANGLSILIDIAKEFGDVLVVAPHTSRSGMSKAITVEIPVRLKKIEETPGFQSYSCTGTPVDCVKIAFHQLLKENPDIVLSGINHGSNSSVNIHYSGTMGAIIEGCLHEVPSVGFSVCNHDPDADLTPYKDYFRKIISETLNNSLPGWTCLNVNAPLGKPLGVKICRQGRGRWVEEYDHRIDPHNEDYYWITGYYKNLDNGSVDTDNHALSEGFISIVPIKVDMTDQNAIDLLKTWNLNE